MRSKSSVKSGKKVVLFGRLRHLSSRASSLWIKKTYCVGLLLIVLCALYSGAAWGDWYSITVTGSVALSVSPIDTYDSGICGSCLSYSQTPSRTVETATKIQVKAVGLPDWLTLLTVVASGVGEGDPTIAVTLSDTFQDVITGITGATDVGNPWIATLTYTATMDADRWAVPVGATDITIHYMLTD